MTMNAADVVFSTVDTVGILLMFLRRARLLRASRYTAIGLPEPSSSFAARMRSCMNASRVPHDRHIRGERGRVAA